MTRTLAVAIMISFCPNTFAKESAPALGSDNAPIHLKTSWEKRFETPANSLAVSADGTRISVTVACKSIKDDAGPCRGGKLYYFDGDGKLLWEYEHKESTGSYELRSVSMSKDGKYVACVAAKLTSWEQEIVKADVDPITRMPGPMRTYSETRYAFQPWETLYFDSSGKLLWRYRGLGWPRVSSDGDYVLIIPDSDESSQPLGDFKFLDRKGIVLWETEGVDLPYETGKMSKGGERIAIGSKVYAVTGEIIYENPDLFFTQISDDGTVGIGKVFKTLSDKVGDGWKKLVAVNLKENKILWEKENGDSRNQEYRDFKHSMDQYFTSNGRVVILGDSGYLYGGSDICVYSVLSGSLVSCWDGKLLSLASLQPVKVLKRKKVLLWSGYKLCSRDLALNQTRCFRMPGPGGISLDWKSKHIGEDGNFITYTAGKKLYFCNLAEYLR